MEASNPTPSSASPSPPSADAPPRARRAAVWQVWGLIAVIAAVAAASWVVETDSGARPPGPPVAATRPGAPAPPPVTPPYLGVALNCHHIGDLELYFESVDHIAAMGANALVLVTPMFQHDVRANEVRLLPARCPTDTQLVAILRRAEQHGLDTTLLPIVLLEHAAEKEWRGVIDPEDWSAWWASYDRFIAYYLDIANRAGVDRFIVGSELNSTEPQIEQWRRIIRRVRGSFRGEVAYASNWDRYDLVDFWDELDLICVSAYFELVDEGETPTPERLRERWIHERDRMLRIARRFDKPLYLTELGYPSVPWSVVYPWNYVAAEDTPADHAAQAAGYRAFFEAWAPVLAAADETGAIGVACYHWDPYRRGDDWDRGYGLRGKPSYGIVKDAFAMIRSGDTPPIPEAAASQPAADAGGNRPISSE